MDKLTALDYALTCPVAGQAWHEYKEQCGDSLHLHAVGDFLAGWAACNKQREADIKRLEMALRYGAVQFAGQEGDAVCWGFEIQKKWMNYALDREKE